MNDVTNRPRSAGRRIQWTQLSKLALRPDWTRVNAGGDRLPPMPPNTRFYGSEQSHCTVMVSRTEEFGWHISVAHPFRHPTWNEIASARYALVPNDVVMVMVLPPEEEYVNLHEHCFHLHQCQCPR